MPVLDSYTPSRVDSPACYRQRVLASGETRPANTYTEMVDALVRMMADGLDPITEDDLRTRFGFSAGEIAEHGDRARAEARRRRIAALGASL